jgi:hypothetical protein
MKKMFLLISLFFLNIPQTLNAQESTETPLLSDSLEYPELSVTPLASQRLKEEALQENKNKWSNLSSIQISGLLTYLAGQQAAQDYNPNLKEPQAQDDNRDKIDNASDTAKLIGGFWFLGATTLTLVKSPYKDGFNEIKKLPQKTKQQRLARERLAEEKINAAGNLGKKIKYLSLATNILANSLILMEAQEDAQVSAAIAVIGAFTPFVFESRWETVSDLHRDYKKKIYGPISFIIPRENHWIPGLGMTFLF